MKIFSKILSISWLIRPILAGDSIFEIVEDDGNFDTLELALEITGLDNTLDRSGSFTLFAPKDSAFNDIDDDTLDCLLESRNRHVLKDVLLYHVLPEKRRAKDFKDGREYKTILGERVEADVSSSRIKINDSRVSKANIYASNGIIHEINAVLIPDAIDNLKCGGGGGSSGKCYWKGHSYKNREWYDDYWRCENGKWKKYSSSSKRDCHWKGKSYSHNKWYNDYWKCVDGDWKKYSSSSKDDCHWKGKRWSHGDRYDDHWVCDDGKWRRDWRSDDDDDSSSHKSSCKYEGKWTQSGRWYKGPTHTCKCYDGHWRDCYRNHRRDLKEEGNGEVDPVDLKE